MPGPAPKHGGRRPSRRKSHLSVVPLKPVAPASTPPATREWLAITKKRWTTFWGSELARAVAPDTDLPALTRLHDLYDEQERALRAVRKQRFVLGSQGQPVLNPAGRLLKELAGEIRMLEDRFGLSPMARLRLGHQYGSTAMTLDDLNRQLETDADEGEDPRLEVIEGEAAAE